MGKKVRTNYDGARIAGLADACAIMLAYMAAIDDAIEVFNEKVKNPEFDAAFDIIALTARCRQTLFNGIKLKGILGEFNDTPRIIRAVQDHREIDIRTTELYRECLNVIRQYVKSIQSYEYTPRREGNGIQPYNTVSGGTSESRVSGSGGGEVEPTRPN